MTEREIISGIIVQVEPNRYYNGIGPDKTSTFYENWEKDIELLLETGHTAFRTSIQWSRIFPQGRGEVNPQGVAFYRQVFEAIKAKGIRLLVNLYHFDLPFALQEDGDGWENKATIKAYEDYARFCFETYGDLVDQWITFNEPIVPVEFGYFYDAHYPHKVDAKAAVKVPIIHNWRALLQLRLVMKSYQALRLGLSST